MLLFKKAFIFFIATVFCVHGFAQKIIYKDNTQPIATRVADLLKRMTAEEKFWQLFMIPGDLNNTTPGQYKNGLFGFQVSAGGAGDMNNQLLKYNTKEDALYLAKKINNIQKYFVDTTRLGIPIIAFDEALHGLVRKGATAFPQAIALAASWDTALMQQVASAIATETKIRGIRQILSPVVNIASDVRWGRTEETYGEDPFLASAMGVAFVKQFEQKGIITTPKHFIANVGEGGRDSYPIEWNERTLDEFYLPPFYACIKKGGSRSIMTAYNSLNGKACSANDWLLLEKLKKQWNFNGFVISDANAVGGELVLHHTAEDYATSGQHAVNNGLDVIFQTDYNHYNLFIPPFLQNKVDSNRLNDAVARVLTAKFELGLFEQPYVDENFKEKQIVYNHKNIAAQAAKESFVLLKNDKQILPLSSTIKSIALIGSDAVAARLGGYSGEGNDKVSILQGLKNKLSATVKINYEEGVGRNNTVFKVLGTEFLSVNNKPGLQASYYNCIDFNCAPALKRIDSEINFRWTLFGPSTEMNNSFYGAKWDGYLSAPETGNIKIGIEGNDGYRMYINNELHIDSWQKKSFSTSIKNYNFVKGKKYAIRIEFYETIGNATVKLIWNYGIANDWEQKINKAVAAAKKSDVAIVVAGIEEGEFSDRALLSLKGKQEEMINAVAKTRKPVIVLLVGGSAVTMQNWVNNVASIACVWYGGEEAGNSIADVLLGNYNPAGRLPITFPLHEGQLPLVYNHKPTGRGDDYNNLSGYPQFPFGYGLSYTSFEYSNFTFSKNNIKTTDTAIVSFTVKNMGKKDGDEVVQLYIKDLLSSVTRPVMELKGFERVHLKTGESKRIQFNITPELLTMLNANLQPVIEAGQFRIMIGASSSDIRLQEILTVQ